MSDVGWREKYANIVKGVKGFLGQAGKQAFTPHEPLPSPMKRKRTKHIFRSNDEKVKLVDDFVAVKDSMQERGFLTKWCAEKDVHPNTVRGWLKNPARVQQMKTGKKTAKAVPRMVEGKTAQGWEPQYGCLHPVCRKEAHGGGRGQQGPALPGGQAGPMGTRAHRQAWKERRAQRTPTQGRWVQPGLSPTHQRVPRTVPGCQRLEPGTPYHMAFAAAQGGQRKRESKRSKCRECGHRHCGCTSSDSTSSDSEGSGRGRAGGRGTALVWDVEDHKYHQRTAPKHMETAIQGHNGNMVAWLNVQRAPALRQQKEGTGLGWASKERMELAQNLCHVWDTLNKELSPNVCSELAGVEYLALCVEALLLVETSGSWNASGFRVLVMALSHSVLLAQVAHMQTLFGPGKLNPGLGVSVPMHQLGVRTVREGGREWMELVGAAELDWQLLPEDPPRPAQLVMIDDLGTTHARSAAEANALLDRACSECYAPAGLVVNEKKVERAR
eukprot:jgi/Mesvir1/12397/Mv00569-RA.1